MRRDRKSRGAYQEVLRLDVPVHNAEAVQVPEGVGQVVHHSTAIPLGVLG